MAFIRAFCSHFNPGRLFFQQVFNSLSIHFFNTLCRKVDTKQFTEYENVKGNLLMQVIPVEPNKEKLEQVPHKTIEDIAVVYRIDVSDSRHHNASVLVTNQMMEHFGITPEQLHQDAVASQMANRPPTLKNMSEMMAEMSGGMILIVFGCIINAVIRQMWPSAGILIVMEACLVMICAAAGVLEYFLEEATTNLGRIIRS